jgi:hypothetical protein
MIQVQYVIASRQNYALCKLFMAQKYNLMSIKLFKYVHYIEQFLNSIIYNKRIKYSIIQLNERQNSLTISATPVKAI